MKVKIVNKILKDTKMQNKECNFKITYPKGTSKLDLILQRLDKIDVRIVHLEHRIDQVETNLVSRINNLVSKNNLKE